MSLTILQSFIIVWSTSGGKMVRAVDYNTGDTLKDIGLNGWKVVEVNRVKKFELVTQI